MKKFLIGLILVLALCSSAFSYSYSAFAFSSGKQTFAVVPYLYSWKSDGNMYGGGDLCLSYGLTDKTDIFFDVNYLHGAGLETPGWMGGTPGWFGMIRYDFGNTKILALKANNLNVSPQFHFLTENERWAFQSNVNMQIVYKTANDPSFYAVLCPLYKIIPGLDMYCELNPSYALLDQDVVGGWVRPKGFGLDVVPGVGFKIASLIFSVAVPIYDVNHKATPSLGMWALYMTTFGKR